MLLLGLYSSIVARAPAARDPPGLGPRPVPALRQQFGERLSLATVGCLCGATDHGRCGVLVPENDVQACADAIETLLRNPGRRAQIAADGRKRAEQLFDAQKTSRILSSWFDEALARPVHEPSAAAT